VAGAATRFQHIATKKFIGYGKDAIFVFTRKEKEGRWSKVKALQHLLVTSFQAKALAVKRVTSNKGTPMTL
jgi:hypothetical protein